MRVMQHLPRAWEKDCILPEHLGTPKITPLPPGTTLRPGWLWSIHRAACRTYGSQRLGYASTR